LPPVASRRNTFAGIDPTAEEIRSTAALTAGTRIAEEALTDGPEIEGDDPKRESNAASGYARLADFSSTCDRLRGHDSNDLSTTISFRDTMVTGANQVRKRIREYEFSYNSTFYTPISR
jgi:hypothetical protein